MTVDADPTGLGQHTPPFAELRAFARLLVLTLVMVAGVVGALAVLAPR